MLIALAAIHRIVFEGRDDERFANLGSVSSRVRWFSWRWASLPSVCRHDKADAGSVAPGTRIATDRRRQSWEEARRSSGRRTDNQITGQHATISADGASNLIEVT